MNCRLMKLSRCNIQTAGAYSPIKKAQLTSFRSRYRHICGIGAGRHPIQSPIVPDYYPIFTGSPQAYRSHLPQGDPQSGAAAACPARLHHISYVRHLVSCVIVHFNPPRVKNPFDLAGLIYAKQSIYIKGGMSACLPSYCSSKPCRINSVFLPLFVQFLPFL